MHPEMVGPLGFEPRTKGFTWPRRFRRARTISSPAALVAVWVRDALACHQGHSKPSGSLCTFRRCTAGLAQDCHQPPNALEGFPEFIPSTRTLSGSRHLSQQDESPALTTELQARRKSSKSGVGHRYESFSFGPNSRARRPDLRQYQDRSGRHPKSPQPRSRNDDR